jgi:Ser/Thr protein kinase RdoA (MazF antagonist)
MIEDILEAFGVARPATVKQINTGLINQTYKVTNSEGIFGLQSLHPVFPDAALTDMQVVTDHLCAHGLNVPKLIPTKTGEYFTRDHTGLRWRLYTWLPGLTHERATGPGLIHEAGKIVGQLHKHLSSLDYRPQGSIPHFHDTSFILEQLTKFYNRLPIEAKPLATVVLDQAPATILDERALKPQVIHGDLKLSNLLFNEQGQAVGIIDFDTLLWRPAAIDLGDAYRSWCKQSSEADASSTFDRALFEQAETGYKLGLGDTTDNRERHLMATRQISYELTARFLIDLVNDNYFGFDASKYPSRKAHNFARATAQLALAQSI